MNPGRPPKTAVALLYLSLVLVSGCATLSAWFRSAGTYAVASSEEMELGGRAQVEGTLMVTDRLSDVMMDTGRGLPLSIGIQTKVLVQPSGLELETNPMGQFFLPHLEPGSYSIAFTEPTGREIWAEFEVSPNEKLLVMVWVQRDRSVGINSAEGTPAHGMFPGTHSYGIQSGSSARSKKGGENGEG